MPLSIAPSSRPRWNSLKDVRRAVPGVTTEVLRAIVEEPALAASLPPPAAAPRESPYGVLALAVALAASVAATLFALNVLFR